MSADPVPDFHLRRIAMATPNDRVRAMCLELVEKRTDLALAHSDLARADMLLNAISLGNSGFTGSTLQAIREYLRDRGVIE